MSFVELLSIYNIFKGIHVSNFQAGRNHILLKRSNNFLAAYANCFNKITTHTLRALLLGERPLKWHYQGTQWPIKILLIVTKIEYLRSKKAIARSKIITTWRFSPLYHHQLALASPALNPNNKIMNTWKRTSNNSTQGGKKRLLLGGLVLGLVSLCNGMGHSKLLAPDLHPT